MIPTANGSKPFSPQLKGFHFTGVTHSPGTTVRVFIISLCSSILASRGLSFGGPPPTAFCQTGASYNDSLGGESNCHEREKRSQA